VSYTTEPVSPAEVKRDDSIDSPLMGADVCEPANATPLVRLNSGTGRTQGSGVRKETLQMARLLCSAVAKSRSLLAPSRPHHSLSSRYVNQVDGAWTFRDKLEVILTNKIFIFVVLGYAAQTFLVGGYTAYFSTRIIPNLSPSIHTF
jgi:hypothetical protein